MSSFRLSISRRNLSPLSVPFFFFVNNSNNNIHVSQDTFPFIPHGALPCCTPGLDQSLQFPKEFLHCKSGLGLSIRSLSHTFSCPEGYSEMTYSLTYFTGGPRNDLIHGTRISRIGIRGVRNRHTGIR